MSWIRDSRKWSLGVACAFAMTLSVAALAEQSPFDWKHAVFNGLTRERVVGLVNVPELVGEGCGPEVPTTIKLYGTPSVAKPPIGLMEFEVTDRQPLGQSCGDAQVVLRRDLARTTEAVPMEESGYEIPAAIAYERAGQWFRIAVQRGSAWMRADNPQHFQQYPELLKDDRLTYLPGEWDGTLWREPGAPAATPVSSAWKKYLGSELPVEVLAVRRLRSGVWIQVRLETESCNEEFSGVTPVTGWVPAHTPAGKPSVWFYSRGC